MSRVHGSSGIIVLVIAALLAGAATATHAPPAVAAVSATSANPCAAPRAFTGQPRAIYSLECGVCNTQGVREVAREWEIRSRNAAVVARRFAERSYVAGPYRRAANAGCLRGFRLRGPAVPTRLVARWTEAKAEARINQGTYRAVNEGEVANANMAVQARKRFLDSVLALCQANGNCPPESALDGIRLTIAAAEQMLAEAKAGHPLKDASCKGTFDFKLLRAGPSYSRFRCDATIADAPKAPIYRRARTYTFYLYVAPATKQGFIVRGLVLHA